MSLLARTPQPPPFLFPLPLPSPVQLFSRAPTSRLPLEGKKGRMALLVLASLCFISALLGMADAVPAPSFSVVGRVYCDTCRAGFVHEFTEYMEGAKVRLECRDYGSGQVSHSSEAVTDKLGYYTIITADDHQEEICEVVLLDSPRDDCKEIPADHRDRARVLLTSNNGMSSDQRNVNPIGYLKDVPLPKCGPMLQRYALFTDDDIN